jgi:hypothetical protein
MITFNPQAIPSRSIIIMIIIDFSSESTVPLHLQIIQIIFCFWNESCLIRARSVVGTDLFLKYVAKLNLLKKLKVASKTSDDNNDDECRIRLTQYKSFEYKINCVRKYRGSYSTQRRR